MKQCCLDMSFQSKILCKPLISLNVKWQFSWKRSCKWVNSWSELTGIVKYKYAWFPHSTRVNYQKKKKTKLDLLLKRVGFLYSFLSRPKWLFTLAQYLMFSDEMSIEQVVNYPASRGPSIFLDKSGRGRDLCQPPRLSLICRSSTETDESVRFETCFSRFCSVRMCLVRNCWLNTRPRYVRCAREVHSSGRFPFERCLR